MYEIEKSVPILERQKAGRFPYEQSEVNDSFVVTLFALVIRSSLRGLQECRVS